MQLCAQCYHFLLSSIAQNRKARRLALLIPSGNGLVHSTASTLGKDLDLLPIILSVHQGKRTSQQDPTEISQKTLVNIYTTYSLSHLQPKKNPVLMDFSVVSRFPSFNTTYIFLKKFRMHASNKMQSKHQLVSLQRRTGLHFAIS